MKIQKQDYDGIPVCLNCKYWGKNKGYSSDKGSLGNCHEPTTTYGLVTSLFSCDYHRFNQEK